MRFNSLSYFSGIACATLSLASSLAADLPTHDEVTAALKGVVGTGNGGFELNMWATIVDRDGVVQVVTFSGDNRGDQWPGSRVISAQKANTANAFSLPALALSTANLFTAVQPGGGLPLYDTDGTLLGAIGLSGDSSCADHNIAWKVRHTLNLDNVPAGVSETADDNIVYDIANGVSAGGWGHAACADTATKIGRELPTTHPIAKKPPR